MNKFLALLLIAALLFTLAACADSGKSDLTPPDETSGAETEAPTEAPLPNNSILDDRSVEFMTFVPPEGYTSVERIIDRNTDGTLAEKTLSFFWDDGAEISYASSDNYDLGSYIDLTTLESVAIDGQTVYFYNEGADHMAMIQIGNVLCGIDCIPADGSEDYSKLDAALEKLHFGECEFVTEVEEGLSGINYDLSVLAEPVSISSTHRVDLEGNTLRKSFTWRFGQDKGNIDYRFLIRVVYGGKVEDELSTYTTYEDGTLQGLPCKIRMDDGHEIEYFVQRGNDVYILKNMGYNGGWYVERSDASHEAFKAFVATVSFVD